MEVAGPGFDAGRFVIGMVALSDGSSFVGANQIRARQLTLQAEPGVSAVTFSSSIPGFAGGPADPV